MTLPQKWILAVDDNLDDLFWMEQAIAGASIGDFSYHLLKAQNGIEARTQLEVISRQCLNGDQILVFTDVNMPNESGLELLKWLKENPRFQEIPVIIVSSFDRRTEIIRAFQLGAVACMFKPPEPMAVRGLLKTIKQLSGNSAEIKARLPLDSQTDSLVPQATRPAVRV